MTRVSGANSTQPHLQQSCWFMPNGLVDLITAWVTWVMHIISVATLLVMSVVLTFIMMVTCSSLNHRLRFPLKLTFGQGTCSSSSISAMILASIKRDSRILPWFGRWTAAASQLFLFGVLYCLKCATTWLNNTNKAGGVTVVRNADSAPQASRHDQVN